MKVQVFILLGLMCYSAFSACDTSLSSNSITINGNSYKFGKDGTTTGCCLITGSTTTAVGGAGGACEPKGFFQIGTEVWIVMETAVAASDPLDVSATAYTPITPFANKGKNLAIGQLDLTAANLGKTLKGSYIGSLPSVGGTWADVAVGTGAAACTSVTTLLSIPITPTSFTVDQTAVPNTDLAIASSTYLGYDTATGRFKGYSSDPCSLTFTSVATVTTNSVEYKVGTRGNECCVQTGTTLYCYNDVNLLGTCTALDIAADSTSNEVWIAIRVSAAAADVMTSSNGITGVDYSDSLLTSGTLIANSVLIGKITTTTGTDFGKFIYAAYVAPKTTAGVYTTFTFTDLRACTSNSVKYAQVEGTLGTSTWVDETGTAIPAATGTGAFLVVTPATGNIEGFNSDGRVCAGASILSIASAILAFVGLVAL